MFWFYFAGLKRNADLLYLCRRDAYRVSYRASFLVVLPQYQLTSRAPVPKLDNLPEDTDHELKYGW